MMRLALAEITISICTIDDFFSFSYVHSLAMGVSKTKTSKTKTSKTKTPFEIQKYNVLSLLTFDTLPAIAILSLPPYFNDLIKPTESRMVIQLWYCMPLT